MRSGTIMLRYIPVMSRALDQPLRQWRGKDMAWWTPNSIFKFPRVMESMFFVYDVFYTKGKDWKDITKMDNSICEVWGDSGGFNYQEFKRKHNKTIPLTPQIVLELQEKYCDKAFVFDLPIKPSVTDVPGTIKNIDAIYGTWNNVDMYTVQHGHTYDRAEDYYNQVVKPYDDFYGIATGAKPANDPIRQAFITSFVAEKGWKKVHVFGVGGFNTQPALAYAAEKFDLDMTYDCGTYAEGAMYRHYRIPMFPKKFINFMTKKKEEQNSVPGLPCHCEICNLVDDIDILYDENNTFIGGHLISFHNIINTQAFTETLNILVKDEGLYKEFIGKFCRPETMKSLEFIDEAEKKGVEYAYRKYLHRGSEHMDNWR